MHLIKVQIACTKEMNTVPACQEKMVWHRENCGDDAFAEDLPEECKIFRNRPAECQTEEIKMACAAAKKFLDFAEGCADLAPKLCGGRVREQQVPRPEASGLK